MKLGVAGAGVMGSAHARVIAEHASARLAVVVDADVERAGLLPPHEDAEEVQRVGGGT